MQFEYDPEVLIAEVSKRPGLWDYEHADYREKKLRMSLWNEVVRALMQTDVQMTKGEMRELEFQLQKKWKSLRDCFQKYLAHPNRTRRPYIYAKQLQFLLKDQKLPKKTGKVVRREEASSESAQEEEEEYKPKWRPKKKLTLHKNEEISDNDNNDLIYDDNSTDVGDVVIKPDASPMKSTVNDSHFAFVDALSRNDSEDPDKMFLLSLMPHLKSIPEEFRLNAKMELMQVLQQANYSISKLI